MTSVASTVGNNAKLCRAKTKAIGKRVNGSGLAESRARMHKAAAAAE
jgi:hypothetical protein